MKVGKINTVVVLKPLQGRGRERWTHRADLSVTLNTHFKNKYTQIMSKLNNNKNFSNMITICFFTFKLNSRTSYD